MTPIARHASRFSGSAIVILALGWVACGSQTDSPTKGPLLSDVKFVAKGQPAPEYGTISDLQPFQGRLYGVASRNPSMAPGASVFVTSDGSSVETVLEKPESEGFLRLRVVDGTLFVPDSDPPGRTPGWIHSSTDGRTFEATEIPRVFHTYDVVLRGEKLLSSQALDRRSGAIFLRASPAQWRRAYLHPTSRLRFMVQFQGALIAATEPDGTGTDFLRWEGDPTVDRPERVDVVPGGALTTRWYVSSRGRIYWSMRNEAGAQLLASDDAREWVSVPGLEGRFVSDLAELDGNLYALTNRGLFGSSDHQTFESIALPPEPSSFGIVLAFADDPNVQPKGNADGMASLAAHDGHLWAGSSNGGVLYRVE